MELVASGFSLHLFDDVTTIGDQADPGGYQGWLKTVFWPFWQFTIFSRF
jgi:hypothetical protein